MYYLITHRDLPYRIIFLLFERSYFPKMLLAAHIRKGNVRKRSLFFKSTVAREEDQRVGETVRSRKRDVQEGNPAATY